MDEQHSWHWRNPCHTVPRAGTTASSSGAVHGCFLGCELCSSRSIRPINMSIFEHHSLHMGAFKKPLAGSGAACSRSCSQKRSLPALAQPQRSAAKPLCHACKSFLGFTMCPPSSCRRSHVHHDCLRQSRRPRSLAKKTPSATLRSLLLLCLFLVAAALGRPKGTWKKPRQFFDQKCGKANCT